MEGRGGGGVVMASPRCIAVLRYLHRYHGIGNEYDRPIAVTRNVMAVRLGIPANTLSVVISEMIRRGYVYKEMKHPATEEGKIGKKAYCYDLTEFGVAVARTLAEGSE